MLATKEKKLALSGSLSELIDRRLDATGLSARSVSLAVVGHDGLIRDIKRGNVPTADRLHALLCHLDASLVLGKPLSTKPQSLPDLLREAAAEIENQANARRE